MLLIIDNYDSFTFNLVQYFATLGQEVKVVRNDEISVAEIEQLAPDYLIISPGPGTPNDAGISLQAVTAFAGRLPILGVCLGHQTIAQAYGATIVKANKPMHGKQSLVVHQGSGLFHSLNMPLQVTRYHSLVIAEGSLTDEFEIDAWVENDSPEPDEIMAIRHKELAIWGVQFHPESILTSQGHDLLANFLLLNGSNGEKLR